MVGAEQGLGRNEFFNGEAENRKGKIDGIFLNTKTKTKIYYNYKHNFLQTTKLGLFY
jgi:hypothetical protein